MPAVDFPTPFLEFDDHMCHRPLTLSDLRLQEISYALRSKPSWWTKYKNPEIFDKWRAELLEHEASIAKERGDAQGEDAEGASVKGDGVDGKDAENEDAEGEKEDAGDKGEDVDDNEDRDGDEEDENEDEDEDEEEETAVALSEKEIDYVLVELSGYEKMRDEETGIQQSCYARIYESDTLIPDTLLQRLKDAVSPLENVPDDMKDWHPRSDEQVLDLVHPSLYCGVYGRTVTYPLDKNPSDRKQQDLRPLNLEEHGKHTRTLSWVAKWAVSSKFTWIPTDFDVAEGGKSAKALGYINNIHPSNNTKLYAVIEDLVARFTFLWDRVLTDLHPQNPVPYRIGGYYEWVEDDGNPEPDEEDFEDYEAYEEAHDQWEESRDLITPTVPDEGYTKDISERKVAYSVQGRKIQVIVKLANIHLAPEKPKYPGGSWHVEGMINERIIASGIYYYDSENITESQLAFRAAVGQGKIDYLQNDGLGILLTYGLGGEGNQILGAVKTVEGRCIAFPNVYQHKVSPFELSDPSKPGHRKIVALFLVDPEYAIPSTTHIAPQQSDWAREAMDSTGSMFGKMPIELLDMVSKDAERSGGLMSLEEAKQYRLELMDERTAAVKGQDQEYFAREFSFCEH